MMLKLSSDTLNLVLHTKFIDVKLDCCDWRSNNKSKERYWIVGSLFMFSYAANFLMNKLRALQC